MSWRDRQPQFGTHSDRPSSRQRDTMQVCENGHQITSMADTRPEYCKKWCPKCGAPTLSACPKCHARIPGHLHIPGVAVLFSDPVPSFCDGCGEAFPWTGKENPDPSGEDVSSQPTTEQVLPLDVVKGTRTYLEQIVNQANGCYEKGWYDACSVMIRKLVEVLIIAVYESKGEADAIKKDGNFLMLSGLIDDIATRHSWNLGRETKAALPLLKSLGDRSAHNRHYLARKADVDKVLPGLRVAVEDLLHHAKLVK